MSAIKPISEEQLEYLKTIGFSEFVASYSYFKVNYIALKHELAELKRKETHNQLIIGSSILKSRKQIRYIFWKLNSVDCYSPLLKELDALYQHVQRPILPEGQEPDVIELPEVMSNVA